MEEAEDGRVCPHWKACGLALSAQLWTQIVQKDKTPKLEVAALTLQLSPEAVQGDIQELQASSSYTERPWLKNE